VLHEIANLRDPAWGIRRAAAWNLGRMGDRRAVPALIAALNGADSELQDTVARALAELKDPRAIEPLTVIATKNTDSQAETAILALGEFKDSRAIATLIEVLTRSGKDYDRAESALGRIGPTAIPALLAAVKSAEPARRARVLDALGWIDNPQATDALVESTKDPDPRVRKAAVGGLTGHWAVPGMLLSPFDLQEGFRLIQQRRSPAPPRDPRVPGLLMAALQDSDEGVQSAAAEGLGTLKVGAAVEPLTALLRKLQAGGQISPSWTQAALRQNIATALGRIGDARAVNALITALADPNGEVRSHITRSLGEIGDPKATEVLLSLLNDRYDSVRRVALMALAQIKDPKATGPLIEAMKKASVEAQTKSQATTPQGTGPAATRNIVMNDAVLYGAPDALSQIGEPAVAPLISAMKSTDPLFRQRILAALDGNKYPSAMDTIIAALNDTDTGVRSAALSKLAGINDPKAALPFRNAWKKSDAVARDYALRSLCRNRAAWATEPVIEAMKGKEWRFTDGCLLPGELNVSPDAVIPLLTDPDNGTRKNAARALLALIPNPLIHDPSVNPNDTRAEVALQKSFKDRNMVVIVAAAHYYVGRGEPGSEDTLIAALNAAGDYGLAELFLVCGNRKLEDAGRAWLKAHNRDVDTRALALTWGTRWRKPAV